MKIPAAPITLTFQPGPFLSEQVHIFENGQKIGYSLTGQYVNIYGRRFAYPAGAYPDFKHIYYTPKEYVRISGFKNTASKARATLAYHNSEYLLQGEFPAFQKDSVKLSKENLLIGGIRIDSGRRAQSSGVLKVFQYTGFEELGVFIAALFIGKDVFYTEAENSGW